MYPQITTTQHASLDRYRRESRERAARLARIADQADALLAEFHGECAQPGCPERREDDESFCQGHALSWVFG